MKGMYEILKVQDWVDQNLTTNNTISLGHVKPSGTGTVGKPELIITMIYGLTIITVQYTINPNDIKNSFDNIFATLRALKKGGLCDK